MKGNETAPLAKRVVRTVRLFLQLVSGLLTVALLFPLYGAERRWRAIQRWSAGVCRIVDLEVCVIGALPQPNGRAIVAVANHISWLDIQMIHSLWRVRFVAKSEVRRWPAIGWLAARCGTLFIHRGRNRHAARINEVIQQALSGGDAIAVFPEGTTSDGRQLLHFHASLLQPAVNQSALVVPVAVRYVTPSGEVDETPSYVGERSLAESMAAVVAANAIRGELHFLPAIDAEGRSRRELAQLTRAAIAAALNVPIAGTAPETLSDPQGERQKESDPKDTRYPA
jgi:1-acyl-sn-glycerol-3-phosphate acyltransferase